jgi:putative membrane protein
MSATGVGSTRSETKEKAAAPKLERSLAKGAVAGLIGGLAGAGAKVLAEKIFPPREPGRTSPPVMVAENAVGHSLTDGQAKLVEGAIHWGFGAAAGAAYGAMVEVEPTLGAWRGAAFGVALNRITHEALLPRLGVVPPKGAQPMQERISEWVTHAFYGIVTDAVRRSVRRALD